MGKRSDFERVEKDFYRTIDDRAVLSLIPHIQNIKTFSEPCVGQKDLKNSLEKFDKQCLLENDIQTGINALEINEFLGDAIITNPPWTRSILHEMIKHFSDHLPTWLLFDSDWPHTKQSSELMKRCEKIISVGRLIWIPDTKVSGKDNCSWYLFNNKTNNNTIFIGR